MSTFCWRLALLLNSGKWTLALSCCSLFTYWKLQFQAKKKEKRIRIYTMLPFRWSLVCSYQARDTKYCWKKLNQPLNPEKYFLTSSSYLTAMIYKPKTLRKKFFQGWLIKTWQFLSSYVFLVVMMSNVMAVFAQF